jgi:hypothetical protein
MDGFLSNKNGGFTEKNGGFCPTKMGLPRNMEGFSTKKIGFTVLPTKRWRCYQKNKVLRTKNKGVAEKKRGFTNIIISE